VGRPPKVIPVRAGGAGADGEYVGERRWYLAGKSELPVMFMLQVREIAACGAPRSAAWRASRACGHADRYGPLIDLRGVRTGR
jgi:hypothetical protein